MEKQISLFSEEWIAMWVLGHDFEEMYPNTKYNLVFEEDTHGYKKD